MVVVVGHHLRQQHHHRRIPLLILAFFFFFFFSSCTSSSNSSHLKANGNADFAVLLAFKSSSDTSNSLISWSKNNNISCSAWLGVTCNPRTHRVTKLVLNYLNLTGSIQVLARLTRLRHLSLHHNHLSVTPDFTAWPDLRHLYLSHNHFTGKFPAGISHFKGLRRLDLSYNDFSGEIPVTELTQLTHLLTLRLESNWFNGTLGSDNSSLKSLLNFNVSENGLAGKIPSWLSKFPVSSFSGNGRLCGKPLPSDCPIKPAVVNPTAGKGPLPFGVTDVKKKKKSSKNGMVLMIIMIDVVAVLLMLFVIACCCYKRKISQVKGNMKNAKGTTGTAYGTTINIRDNNASGEMVCFEGCKGFAKVDDLLKASAEMLGKGSLGTTYRVVMDGGDVVVVKRVREKGKRIKDVDVFLREIGGLRHPNIVSLRAYYSSKEELLLVYDFLKSGSLYNLLHGNRGPGRTPLDWPTRLKFALGSAGGLAFLHGYSTKSKLFHGHLTSSNILIDNQGNACISDIGLHQLLQVPSLSNNAYKAPEMLLNNNPTHNQTRKYRQKCDVYSFGVVLLEILTGKMATSEGETSLAKWVQRVGREEWTWDVFDFELVRHKEMEQEMIALLQVAILCLASSPKDRPKMSMVLKMIEDIRIKRDEAIGIRPPHK